MRDEPSDEGTMPSAPPPSHPGFGVTYLVPWCAVAATVILALLLPGFATGKLGLYALAGSIFLFGLPHGSADWWVMRLAAGGRWNLRTQALCSAVYVLASVVTLLFWRALPATALVGFLFLTAWHFGSAEASVLMPYRPTFRDASWWMFAVGRGLLVVFMSLAFRPVETFAVLLPFVELGGNVPAALVDLGRTALWLVWIGALLQTFAIRQDARALPGSVGRRRFTRNIVETCLLLMLFRLVPPLLAFACYWVAFHAWRHIWRLEWIVEPEDVGMPWWRMLLDFHRRTLPLTLASLLGLGLVFLVWPTLARSANTTVAYLILLSILTVPHAIVIGWLDRRRMKDEG